MAKITMDKQLIFSAVLAVAVLGVAAFLARDILTNSILLPDIPFIRQNAETQKEQNNPADNNSQKLPKETVRGENNIYEHATADFRVTYPGGWTVNADVTPEIVALFLSPKEGESDTFGENVIVRYVSATSTMDLKQFASVMIDQEKARFADGAFTLISRESIIVSGLPAERIAYKVAKAIFNKFDGKALSIIVLKENGGYVVTYSAIEDVYDRLLEDANIIFDSFTLQ